MEKEICSSWGAEILALLVLWARTPTYRHMPSLSHSVPPSLSLFPHCLLQWNPCKARGGMELETTTWWEASLMAQLAKNLPAMRETWVRSLGWKGPLEKGKATHSSILAWKIPWTI